MNLFGIHWGTFAVLLCNTLYLFVLLHKKTDDAPFPLRKMLQSKGFSELSK